jgi:uncharacterized protein YggE
MGRQRWIAAGLLSVGVWGGAARVAAQEPPPVTGELVPAIAVTGSGEVRRAPDEATVRLGVTAQAETARAAQEEANRVASAILQGVEALGVDRGAIQTSRLMLDPVYHHPGPDERGMSREPRIVGYRASNVVSVRLEDLTRVGPVIDAAVEAGANEVQGVDFRLQDDLAARQEALGQAVATARAKAGALAAALGVRLGSVLDARESSAQVVYPQMDVRAMRMSAEVALVAPTPVAPGEIAVRADVNVTYRIAGGG